MAAALKILMKIELTNLSNPIRMQVPRPCKKVLLGICLVVGLITLAGCSQGSYPLDIFYEMHYQQSFKSHEPPRLSGVAEAVPWFPAPRSTAFEANTGRYLFEVNCSMCHGAGGEGDGPVLSTIVNTYGYELIDAIPPDLTSPQVRGMGIGGIQGFMSSGAVLMPSFEKLLNAQERRAIAEYIVTLPSAATTHTEEVQSASPAPTVPPAPTAPPAPSVGAGTIEISVNIDDLEFDVVALPEVVAGSEVVLVFNNASTINQHNWVLVRPGTKDSVATRGTGFAGDGWIQPQDPDVIASTSLLSPGESGEVRFTAPQSGAYQFVCTFPGHNATMFGDLVVVP